MQYIQTLAEQKVVTKEEVIKAYDSGSELKLKQEIVLTQKLRIAKILYYLGGGIVFLGIVILLWQRWSILSFTTKVLATLGCGIAAYLSGVFFSLDKRTEKIAPSFYLISALVTPVGLRVVLSHEGLDPQSSVSYSLIFAIMVGIWFPSFFVFRRTISLLFTILFSTFFFFSITDLLLKDSVLNL